MTLKNSEKGIISYKLNFLSNGYRFTPTFTFSNVCVTLLELTAGGDLGAKPLVNSLEILQSSEMTASLLVILLLPDNIYISHNNNYFSNTPELRSES